jgi:exodeoxyribonuclease VII large subunit
MADELIFSVSQLNNYVKGMLEKDPHLTSVYLVGEISNFTNHYKSGHFYMSLKDDNAVIKAVMFRSAASRVRFDVKNGLRVICRGRVSLYERDGSYQFYIDQMQPDGAGDLQLAFEQLTARLREEGLFDEAHKRPLPKYPARVAVITSETGAAVQDIRNILSRRCPSVEMIMCPVLVQGEGAAPQLIDAVKRVNAAACADVIIIGRGGGSLEDLWAFNDEGLARTIYASQIPVISAVGHETDFTICDFVADMRAPTPSAAAELAVPDRREVYEYVVSLNNRQKSLLKNRLSQCRLRLQNCTDSAVMRQPTRLTDMHRERLDYTVRDLNAVYAAALSKHREQLKVLCANLGALNPLNTLARGYAVASVDKKVIKSVEQLSVGDRLSLRLHDGSAKCTVETIKKLGD